MTIEICPACSSEKINQIIRTETFKYKELIINVGDYKIYSCRDCGEEFPEAQNRKDAVKMISEKISERHSGVE